jgi:hypothetical protein
MKLIQFDGVDHEFPDDATDEEIAGALEEMHPAQRSGGQAGGMGDVKMAESRGYKPEIKSTLFPAANEIEGQGFGASAGRVLTGVADLFGAPQRAIATLRGQSMSDPGAHFLKPETDAAVAKAQSDLDAHPELKDYIPPGGFGGMPMMMPTPAMSPGLTEVGGREIDDPMMYLGPLVAAIKQTPKLLEYLGKAAGVMNKHAGRLASEASGVPEEALRAFGDPAQKAKMAENYGKEREIGGDLLDKIDNPDPHIPERAQVDASLERMPDQSLEPALAAMEGSKGRAVAGRLSPEKGVANGAIQRYIDFLRGGDLPPDLAEAAQEAGRTARSAKGEAVAKGAEAARSAKQATQAERAAAYAQSKAAKAAGQAGTTKKAFLESADRADRNVTRYGGERNEAGTEAEAALEEARNAARKARETATEARAHAAVGDVSEADAKAAESAADAAERAHHIAQVAARLKAGDNLHAIAKDFSSQGMPRENLGAILKAGKARAEAIKDLPPQTVSAKEFRDLRRDLDVPVDWDAEGAQIKNDALKAGRTTMKNQLLQAAEASGDKGYADAMRGWSDKLDKLERIKDLLGKTGKARDKRVEQFVNNLFGKNSAYKQDLMRDLDAIFKTDLVDRARAADMAASLGEGGKPAWLPRQVTGASVKAAAVLNTIPVAGQVATLGTASPRIAATFTLPMLSAMERNLKAAGIALTPRAASVMNKMKGPVTDAQRARMATILAAELESQLPNNAIPFRRKVAEDDDTTGERRAAR